MARTTIGVGILLIVLGLIGYLGSGRASVTALIPAFFGAPIAGMGFLALEDRRRKMCMHIAVTLGLLGAIGSGMRCLPKLGELPAFGISMQLAMFVVCLVFVVMCVKSFKDARRAG